MSVLSILATAFGVIGGFANIPQIIKIYKRKSAKDISILTYSIILMGAIVWLLYGIEIANIPILVSNGFATISFTFIIIGWILYGKQVK